MIQESQQAVYTALAAVITRVYDDVPFLPDGAPDENFPYAVVGQDSFDPFDTDSSNGMIVTFYVHFWSRYAGMKEVKTMMDTAYNALHKQTLTLETARFIDCLNEFSEVFLDPDGRTRHGVQRYRLTIQQQGD